jgi:GNAT superfamily N-acetyltransferase
MDRLAFREIDVDRDAETCVRFRVDSFVECFGSADRFYQHMGENGERYLEGLRAKLKRLPGTCVHAWLGDRIVGQLELRCDLADAALGHVLLYYLTPEYRGSGLANALDNYAIAFLRQAGAVRAYLRVSPANARALAYYRKHGWQEPGADPERADVIRVERDL